MARFLIVHLSLGAFGGAERVCHHIIKSLIEHDQEVELLSFEFDRDAYRKIIGEEVPQRIIIHEMPYKFKIKPPFTIYKKYYLVRKSLINFRKKCSSRYDFLFLTQSSNPLELNFLTRICNRVVGYVHFPEIHHEYEGSGLKRKIYLWPFKHLVEKGVNNLDLIICNSHYTKEMIMRYWRKNHTKNIEVVYPPVDLDSFWCTKPLNERENKVVYIGRFIPAKKHEIMKKLAKNFPSFEFVSAGLLIDEMKGWFKEFCKDMPENYLLKPNLPKNELIKILQGSKIYVHLMEGEHFGIAPIEALASGCITLIPENSGAREFIPEIFRWRNEEDLKNKLFKMMNADENWWSSYREILWQKIKELDPKNFSAKIWKCLKDSFQYL